MTSCTWAFLPRIIVYNRYVWAFIPYTTIYIAYMKMKSAFRNANMASSLALVVICILSTSSYSSPTTDLLETDSRL